MMVQPCPDGELCNNYNCHHSHPIQWWKCDYGPLCFVSGCPGVHPDMCKQSPCRNIKNCNFRHVEACQYGSTCNNRDCHNLHPPPCANANCNGADCPFTHPNQPKFEFIVSLSNRPQSNQNKPAGNFGGSPNPRNQGFANAGAAPSAGWAPGPGNTQNQPYNPSPAKTFTSPKSEVACRYGANCTKPSCPFKH